MGNGRGKRKSNSNSNNDGDRTKAALVLLVIIFGAALFYPVWGQYLPNIPWGNDDVSQGLKLTGTVTFSNNSAVSGTTYSTNFVNLTTRTTAYTGTISGGSFLTNRGPVNGGTFGWYISISGCMLYVGQVTIPKASDYEHESYSVGGAVIYPNAASNGWSVLATAGAVSNAFTGGGSAATTNFTASAGVAQNYDFKVTLATDYAKLFRQYTDPYDGIPIEPVLWIEIGSATGIYSTDSDVVTWSAGSTSYFLLRLSQLTCPNTNDVSEHFDLNIVVSSAGSYTFKAYIVDGSSLAYLQTAKAQVANPASGETVTTHSLISSYVVAS